MCPSVCKDCIKMQSGSTICIPCIRFPRLRRRDRSDREASIRAARREIIRLSLTVSLAAARRRRSSGCRSARWSPWRAFLVAAR